MNKAELHYKKMTEEPVAKLITSLAIPSTVSMLITSLYNLVDTYFVGTLGESAQGAIGVVFALQGFIQAFSFMLGHGSGTYVSKELADKNVKGASTYVSSAFFFGLIFSLVFSFFGLIFLSPFMRLLGSTDTILPYARDYGMWALISCPALLCSIILNNNLRYEGKAFYSMIGLVSGAVLNIFLDYVFINVLQLGVFGAGMATALSQAVSLTVLLTLFFKKAQSKISFKYLSKNYKTYLQIIRVGLPSLLRQGLLAVSTSVLNNVVKPYGDSSIAAITIVNRYSAFVSCLAIGIGQGFQPVAAFNYQTKDYDRVFKGLIFTACLSFLFVGLFSLTGILFPSTIIYIFQKEKAVIDIGKDAVFYASLGLPFCSVVFPTNMLYQSIRKTRPASVLAILRSGAILIPCLLALNGLMGFKGVILAQPFTDFLTALICVPFLIRFYKEIKKR